MSEGGGGGASQSHWPVLPCPAPPHHTTPHHHTTFPASLSTPPAQYGHSTQHGHQGADGGDDDGDDDGGEGHEWYEENILKGDSDVRYDAGRPFIRSFDLII